MLQPPAEAPVVRAPSARGPLRERRPRVLCVDDDPLLLTGLELRLNRAFEVVTATSAAEALSRLDLSAPFAAVISDMRMPRADGATFLSAIRRVAPETTRILLTGQVDLSSVITAVNEGEVFRILLKPIESDTLIAVLQRAVEHHNAFVAQRDESAAILRGSIALLTNTLASLSPALAELSQRLRMLVNNMVSGVDPTQLWVGEWASVLLHVALADVSIDVAERWRSRRQLSGADLQQIEHAILEASAVVSRIPKTEPVRAVLESFVPAMVGGPTSSVQDASLPTRAIKLALKFDAYRLRGRSEQEALEAMLSTAQNTDLALFEALERSVLPM